MAKSGLYGDRWKAVGNLGGGGQGDVYRVVDTTGALSGEYALKRLRDLRRLDRFRNEVEALKRLQHPNIIQLIDNSDLMAEGDNERHYLVMPIAAERDAERRLPIFTGSIENTVRVGLQVAKALQAAHQQKVTHRDVKPANILFPDQSFNVWLSDFGICHLEKAENDTPFGDVMGPRRFAAPEIEAGRAEEVPPEVDIYSLGQTLFYLLSGGRTFHREEVNATTYDQSFPPGEQSELLRALFSNMVALQERRITDMGDVIVRLERVLSWTGEAKTHGISGDVRGAILAAKRKVQDFDKAHHDLQRRRELYDAMRKRVVESIKDTINGPMKAAADLIAEGGELAVRVTETSPAGFNIAFGTLRANPFLSVCLTVSRAQRQHKISELQFWLCSKRVVRVTVQMNTARPSTNAEPTDEEFLLIPLTLTTYKGAPQKSYAAFGIDHPRIPMEIQNHSLSVDTRSLFGWQRQPPSQNQRIEVAMLEFKLSDWPEKQGDVISHIDSVIGVFIEQTFSDLT
ncbi:protein kinase domain-containing protein [Methylobacterium sp. J-077]|uniref:protein kinase domain-containing protein n=1 Tax=Methylobacterium sp. J-077 TaxID=2836656 RepID=UPI001FBA75AF|nr:protein kinase [Methylobacterium sp. J-077]MCJ2126790.1 protein kinase [Methylobacterium sp. J-077]